MVRHFRCRGVYTKAVLDAIRPLLADVFATRDGALFVPPVPFAEAFGIHGGRVRFSEEHPPGPRTCPR